MAEETLVTRAARLEQLVSQRRPAAVARSASGKAGGAAASLRALQQLAGRDALLDTLLALYDECNKDGLKQNPLVASFVTKCKSQCRDSVGIWRQCLKWCLDTRLGRKLHLPLHFAYGPPSRFSAISPRVTNRSSPNFQYPPDHQFSTS